MFIGGRPLFPPSLPVECCARSLRSNLTLALGCRETPLVSGTTPTPTPLSSLLTSVLCQARPPLGFITHSLPLLPLPPRRTDRGRTYDMFTSFSCTVSSPSNNVTLVASTSRPTGGGPEQNRNARVQTLRKENGLCQTGTP